MSSIRDNFRRIRESMNITQAYLAEYLGIDQSMLSKFEKGERELSTHHLDKACLLFGCFIQDLEIENFSPSLKILFRAKELESIDLESISKIQQIALNIIEMKGLLHED